MAEAKPQWMSIGKAAKYLGVSRDSLRRWEKKGKIKAIRSPSNRRYYTKKQLDEVMSGKRKSKKRKAKVSLAINNKLKLVIIGFLSFLAAALLAFFLQYFLLA